MRTRWLVCGLHIVVHESCHDVFELRRELLVLHQGIGEGFQPALKCEKLRSCPFIRPPPPPPPHIIRSHAGAFRSQPRVRVWRLQFGAMLEASPPPCGLARWAS
jgi:hypothetical protein